VSNLAHFAGYIYAHIRGQTPSAGFLHLEDAQYRASQKGYKAYETTDVVVVARVAMVYSPSYSWQAIVLKTKDIVPFIVDPQVERDGTACEYLTADTDQPRGKVT
jgi:hypothetical protein